MNLSWYLFFGRRIGMSREEIINTDLGEMTDMISCQQIYEGSARAKKLWTYDEVMALK